MPQPLSATSIAVQAVQFDEWVPLAARCQCRHGTGDGGRAGKPPVAPKLYQHRTATFLFGNRIGQKGENAGRFVRDTRRFPEGE